MNTSQTLRMINPNEPATDAVTRTAQEILAALEARDSARVASYYAPDAVLATPGRPAVRGGEAVSKSIRNDIADPNFKLSVSDGKTDVSASGDLAYRRVSLTVTYTNPQTKEVENAAATLTEADVLAALEIIDALPLAEVERLRASIAATAATLQASQISDSPSAPGAPVVPTDPVLIACVFYLKATSEAFLARAM